METGLKERKWIVVRIDGKIAAVSTDYRMLASISAHLAGRFRQNEGQQNRKSRRKVSDETYIYKEISATAADFEEVWKLRQEVKWDDLMLFGTDFQKTVWKKLWELTHPAHPQEDASGPTGDAPAQGDTDRSGTRLICYSDFAELCQNRAGVRAVAHAIGLNPVSVIIPCHLVIPKEGIDKISDIQKKAETTIFKGDDLCLSSILQDQSIDFGEYALGKAMKRELIRLELTGNVS